MQESQHTEWKESWRDDYLRWVCGFANAEGGTLVSVLTELDVECELRNIPEGIRVKVDHLGLNEMLKVRELEVPPGVKVLNNPDDIVAVVHPPRGTTAEELGEAAAEGAAEPEVIGKGLKEEAEGEAGE